VTSNVEVFAGTEAGDFETDDAAGEPVGSGAGAGDGHYGNPGQLRKEVNFADAGAKWLVLAYANLETV
jgi:hypothetical protein